LLGDVKHENIAKKLETIDPEFGTRVKRLRGLRSLADYDPGFVGREFQGNQDEFRIEVRRRSRFGLR
jgi:hypothetical protein